MSRVHDMGGQTGFGAVPVDDDDADRQFHEDWEARVFALNRALLAKGAFNLDEFRDAIERISPGEYLGSSYYERWLRAIEMLVTEKGLA